MGSQEVQRTAEQPPTAPAIGWSILCGWSTVLDGYDARISHEGGCPYSRATRGSIEVSVTVLPSVEAQDGRRFWGKAASRQSEERIVGVISYDGRTILWQSSDG